MRAMKPICNYGNDVIQNCGNEANYDYGNEAYYTVEAVIMVMEPAVTEADTAAMETNPTQLHVFQLVVTGCYICLGCLQLICSALVSGLALHHHHQIS